MSDLCTYPRTHEAPGLARARLEEFSDRIEPALLDDLRIITSELVSNAVLHSGRREGVPIKVKTSLAANVMRVKVTDYGAQVSSLPVQPDRRSGLGFVQLISDRWAAAASPPFYVWAAIDVVTNGLVRRPLASD